MEYLLHYECPKCDGDVYSKGLNLIEHNGLPVFDIDHFAQVVMTCQNPMYVSFDDDDDIKTPEEYQKLTKEEMENYYEDECGYSFGTGDIDVLGEDDW